MGTMALSWSVAAVSALVAAVSAIRVVTTGGENRFAAVGELLMGLCMAAMALPATVAWYASYGMLWAAVFALLGLGGVGLAVKHAREHGWKHGRHWAHLIVGSAGMVIMTLAMTSTSSGPVLALGGSSMAHMPGMENMGDTSDMSHMEDMGSMPGMESMPGMNTAAADGGASAGSSSMWRLTVAALAVYFLLSVGASVWARVRGTGNGGPAASHDGGRGRSWGRWLLSMPDTVIVFLVSLTIPVWDRARTREQASHGRRRKLGAAPDAALAAHIGMGGAMSTMLLMMVV
ncbi:DUF5134 domain-containing protein [Streptomyces sp. PRKS01-29]|nr:DUF5134 domain-containing protein [Streptomyces sabulosicollis]